MSKIDVAFCFDLIFRKKNESILKDKNVSTIAKIFSTPKDLIMLF